METMQPWASGFNRPKPLPTQMSVQRPQQTLSREEQLEARRLAEESSFRDENSYLIASIRQ